jgi:glycosyltransferase involved in cell wall biosynthesis
MSTYCLAEPLKIHEICPPRVSIIMLTYDRSQLIGRAIQSIVDQDFHDWELIVVHDGPNDEIEVAMHKWCEADIRIRYFRRTRAGNIANATNYGLSRARGEYIAILDDDDFWVFRHKLREQVKFLDENPDYVACGGGMIVVDQAGCEQLRCIKRVNDADLKRWALLANPIAHSTSMLRRSALNECGRYDESLEGFQDWDVFLKLGKRGKFYNFPIEFTSYTLWAGGGSFAQHRKNTRSALSIVRRHGRNYRGFVIGMTAAVLHHAYAHLPDPIRRFSFSFLSRTKKALFANHDRAKPSPNRIGEEAVQLD